MTIRFNFYSSVLCLGLLMGCAQTQPQNVSATPEPAPIISPTTVTKLSEGAYKISAKADTFDAESGMPLSISLKADEVCGQGNYTYPDEGLSARSVSYQMNDGKMVQTQSIEFHRTVHCQAS